jgi:hypothetical protein
MKLQGIIYITLSLLQILSCENFLNLKFIKTHIILCLILLIKI